MLAEIKTNWFFEPLKKSVGFNYHIPEEMNRKFRVPRALRRGVRAIGLREVG